MRSRLQGCGESRNPDVVADELVLIDKRVVHPVDTSIGQRPVVGPGRADEVTLTTRLVQVVIQVRAGRHQAVDGAPVDQVGKDQSQSARAESPGDAQEDQKLVAEHPLPYPVGRGEIPSLERDPLHPPKHLVHRKAPFHPVRFDRRGKKPRLPGSGHGAAG